MYKTLSLKEEAFFYNLQKAGTLVYPVSIQYFDSADPDSSLSRFVATLPPIKSNYLQSSSPTKVK